MLIQSPNTTWQHYDMLPVPCLVLTPSKNVLFANTAYLNQYHLKKEEVNGLPLLEVIETTAASYRMLEDSFNKILQKPGEIDTIDLKNGYGNFAGTSQNVHIKNVYFDDKMSAESYILHCATSYNCPALEDLNAVFNNTPEGFILTDEYGIVQLFNKTISKNLILGISNEVKIGESVFNVVNADERELFERIFKNVLGGKSMEFNQRFLSDTGKISWINLMASPVKKDKKIRGVCITLRDITLLEKARQKLRERQQAYTETLTIPQRSASILNNIPAHIALIDMEGTILEVNDTWRHFDIGGFKGDQFKVGENYYSIPTDKMNEDELKMNRGVKAMLALEIEEFLYEYSRKEHDDIRWYRKMVSLIKDASQKGVIIMHMDITELKRLEDERMHTMEEEQQRITEAILHGQEKERDHIGRELHDNVNQILAGTRMYLAVAGSRDAKVKESISEAVVLLDRSISEIRTLCKSLVSPVEDIPLYEMMEDLVNKIRLAGLEVFFDYTVEGITLTDKQKINIYRIVQELTQNILKHAGAKRMTIRIWSEPSMLCLKVTDDGAGYDLASKKTGMGLSNINSRIKSIEGTIETISKKGKGTKTYMCFPI